MFICRVHLSIRLLVHILQVASRSTFSQDHLPPRHTHQALIEASSKSPAAENPDAPCLSGYHGSVGCTIWLLEVWKTPFGRFTQDLGSVGSVQDSEIAHTKPPPLDSGPLHFRTPQHTAPRHGPQGRRKVHVSQRLIELMAEGQRLQLLRQYRLMAGNGLSKDENLRGQKWRLNWYNKYLYSYFLVSLSPVTSTHLSATSPLLHAR